MPDVAALLAAYDAQLRAREPTALPAGAKVERDGPVARTTGLAGGGFVGYRDLGGLDGDALDALIARQVTFFAERGMRFEWKTHGHDLPEELTEHLQEAGLEPEERETVVIGEVAAIATGPLLPAGVTLREVTERADFERIAAMEDAVWGEDTHAWLADMLDEEHTADPESPTIVVAEAGGVVVCAGWVRYERGTDFATLWGGGTRPEWRGRGIYKATVAHRAGLAAGRGFRYLEVDASEDSRPILERLGFVPVTTTTPYVWTPPANH